MQQTWQQVGALERHLSRPVPPSLMRRPAMQAMAAGAVLAAILLGYRLSYVEYESQPGRQLQVQLEAGMAAVLDADSAIRVSRWSGRPDVTLVRGSAYFDVQAHGSGLQVHVADTTLRDIGTRFVASIVEDDGRVAVAQGRVEVNAGEVRQMLGAGQQTRFAADRVEVPVSCDPQHVAPWLDGEYRFAAATLAEVADALWRHSRMRLDIPDASVAALTVSGNFEIGQPDKLVWAVAQIHDLQSRKLPDGYRLVSQP